MALSVVNSVSAYANAVSSATTATMSVTTGNLIVVGTVNYDSTGSNDDLSVTDSAGNTYTKIGSSVVQGTRHASLWYAKNVTGGAGVTFTYTVAGGATDYPHIHVVQVAGADTTAPLDQSGFAASGTIGSTLTSPTITTTLANEILFAIGEDPSSTGTESFADGGAANNTGAWTTDQTTYNTSASLTGAFAHAIVSVTGSYAVTQTVNVAQNVRGLGLASFKAAAAGTSMTIAGPNGATTLPSNHNGTVLVTLTGTGTTWGGTTVFTASALPTGWAADTTYNAGKAYLFTTTTAATMRFTVPAVASPPAGATGTITITESVTGTVASTIVVATPTLAVTPASAGLSTGAISLAFTGANTLWQGDNPQVTMSALTGSSLGASTATTNIASSATMTVGGTAGATTLTDPSTGATATFTVTATSAYLMRSRQIPRMRGF